MQVAFYDDVPRFTQMVNKIADELEARVADGRRRGAGGRAARARHRQPDVASPTGRCTTSSRRPAPWSSPRSCAPARATTRNWSPRTPTTLDGMLDDIAEKYLDINCACFTPNPGRIDDVMRLAREYKADGIVHYALQFCGPYHDRGDVGGDVPRARPGYPSCAIDTDYSMEDIGQLSTRVEAFLEMLA